MTTSELVRELPKEMEILLWSHQLQAVKFEEYAALRLLSDAACCMHSARNTERSLMARFLMVNEGIHALSVGVLYLHGVLPTGGVGHRAMVMQLACEQLQLPAHLTNAILYANTHRELIAYGSTEPVQAEELAELTALGEMLMEQVRYEYPEWVF